jgi:hypothetical protein
MASNINPMLREALAEIIANTPPATTPAHQAALRKIYAAMGTIKVARAALQSSEMSEIDENVCDSLEGVYELLDQAYGHLADPVS